MIINVSEPEFVKRAFKWPKEKKSKKEVTESNKLCSFHYFGKKPVEQNSFRCDPCNLSQICDKCNKTCHRGCLRSNNDGSTERDLDNFVCECGELQHTIGVRLPKECDCAFMEIDTAFGISPTLCETHNGQVVCSFCELLCHNECTKNQTAPTGQHCQCKNGNHSLIEDNRYINAISDYINAFLGCDRRIYFSQMLNYFFSGKIIDQLCSSLENEQKIKLTVLLLSNTFNKSFREYFFSPEILQWDQSIKLSSMFSLYMLQGQQEIELSFHAMNTYLHIKLKPEFQLMKSYTSSDFLSMPILQRLLHRYYIHSDNVYPRYFKLSEHLTVFYNCVNFFQNLQYDFKRYDTKYKYFLLFVKFFLKRMLLGEPELILLIKGLENFHRKLVGYLNEVDSKKVIEIKANLFHLIEVFFLIAVNWNDLTTVHIQMPTNERDKTENTAYIHNSPNQNLLIMIIEAFDQLKFAYEDTNERNAAYESFWQMSKESLNLFIFIDNFYYSQIQYFSSESGNLLIRQNLLSRMPADDIFYRKKNEIEAAMQCFFTTLPVNQEQVANEFLQKLREMYDALSVVFQSQVDPNVTKKYKSNLKLYPVFKQLRRRFRLTDEPNIVDNLVYFNFDETITKILHLFSQIINYHGNAPILTTDDINSLLSLLLPFLSSKHGYTYFLTGKNLSRIIKVISKYKLQDNENVLQFLAITFKGLKRYGVTSIKGHKILRMLRIVFERYNELSNNQNWFKIQLTLFIKIFYTLSDQYEYQDFENIQKDILQLFTHMKYLNLAEITTISEKDYDVQSTTSCFRCQSVYDSTGNIREKIANIRLYFAFCKLITKNTYYIYEKNYKECDLIFRQNISDFQTILSTDMLCLKERRTILVFLKTFYFIERLSKTDYMRKTTYMTPDEYFNYVNYILRNYEKYRDQLRKDKYPYFLEPAPTEDSAFNFSLISNKKIAVDQMIKVLEIFEEEITKFEKLKPKEKNAHKKILYLKDLILSVHYISNFFYFEQKLIQPLISSFNNLARGFINNASQLLSDYMLELLRLTKRVKAPLNLDDIKKNFDIAHMELIVQAFSKIFKYLEWNDYSLKTFIKEYDMQIERSLQQSTFFEENDYEYFYEEEEEPQKGTQQAETKTITTTLVKFLKSAPEKKVIFYYNNIDNLVFNSLLGIEANGVESNGYRQLLIYNFVSFAKNDGFFSAENSEFFLNLISKLVYFSVKVSQDLFNGLPQDETFVISKRVKESLLENIVHGIALAKNPVMCKKFLKINYITRMIFQFLQILKLPFIEVIFNTQKELENIEKQEKEIEYQFYIDEDKKEDFNYRQSKKKHGEENENDNYINYYDWSNEEEEKNIESEEKKEEVLGEEEKNEDGEDEEDGDANEDKKEEGEEKKKEEGEEKKKEEGEEKKKEEGEEKKKEEGEEKKKEEEGEEKKKEEEGEEKKKEEEEEKKKKEEEEKKKNQEIEPVIEDNEAKLIDLIKNNLIWCYSLLSKDPKISFDLPNDPLIVLITNMIKFILSISNITNSAAQSTVHQIIDELFKDKKLSNLYFNCENLSYSNNSLKMYYMADVILQLLLAYLPVPEEATDEDTKIQIQTKKDFVIGKVKTDFNPSKLYALMITNINHLMNFIRSSSSQITIASPVKNPQESPMLQSIQKENYAGMINESSDKKTIENPMIGDTTVAINPVVAGQNIKKNQNTEGNQIKKANEAFKEIEKKYSSDEIFRENLQLKFILKVLSLIKILSDDYRIFELQSFKDKNSYESLLFFHMMQFVTKIEIKNRSGVHVGIYFIRPTLTFYLSEETKNDFVDRVDREKAETKLTSLVKQKTYFMLDMMFNSKKHAWSFLGFLKLSHVHLFNFLIIITENALLLAIYYRSPHLPQREYDADVDIFAVPEWDLWLGIAHVPFLLFFMFYTLYLSHTSFRKVFLKKKVDRLTDILKGSTQKTSIFQIIDNEIKGVEQELTHENKITRFEKLSFACRAIGTNVDFWIFSLNLALLIIFLSTRNPIWLVLPTLFVMYINAALSNIILALEQSWYKLLTVLLFTYMCIYIFMWFNLLYYTELFAFDAMNNGEKINENYCHSSIPCLLLMIDKGIRDGGGIGDEMNFWSYKTHLDLFIMRFFYVLIFHIIVILILLNVFLGIIVDAYKALRDKTDQNRQDIESICFICQLTKDESLIANINFDNHRDETHNLWNYIYFITYLNLKNPHEFTANEQYVWEKLAMNDISWFPVREEEKS